MEPNRTIMLNNKVKIPLIGLGVFRSPGDPPPPRGTTGLYHLPIRYPKRVLLADALRRLDAANIALKGASDHGVSEALYLQDPDSNGIEIYWDRPQELWPRKSDGSLSMLIADPLGLDDLLDEPAEDFR